MEKNIMRKYIYAGALLAFSALYPASAYPASNMAKEQSASEVQKSFAMMEKASASFSPYAWESKFQDIKDDLSIIKSPSCQSMADYMNECSFADKNNVVHYFWDEDMVLVVKSLKAQDFEGKDIKALGIGGARAHDEVVANVQKFLPDVKIDCLNAEEAGQGDNISSCSAAMGEGWFTLLFGPDGELIGAQIDAYHFT